MEPTLDWERLVELQKEHIHVLYEQNIENNFNMELRYNMENPLMHRMHQQTSQEQTEGQNLEGDQVDRPLKHCRDSINFYQFSKKKIIRMFLINGQNVNEFCFSQKRRIRTGVFCE